MAISRRQFLKRSAASAAALTAFGPRLRWLPGTGVSYAGGPANAIVVFVQLYGGNDGLNTVYPVSGFQRTKYAEFRPTLKLPATNGEMTPWMDEGFGSSTVLSIGANANGSTYALHPAMGALHALYQSGDMAVVNGVHYPFADHSHFRSEAIWYTVDPLGSSGLGWFGQYLDNAGFTPTQVPGIMLSDSLNPLFTPAQTSLFAFNRLSELRFPAEGETLLKQGTFRQLYDESDDLNPGVYPELVKIGQTGLATIDNIQDYYKVGSGLGNAGMVEALLLDEEGSYDADNPLVYDSPLNPSNTPVLTDMRLARDLRHVAATIRANIGARFFHVAIGGFDSHSNQEQGFFHSYLLQEVSESIAAFYGELNQTVSLPGGYSGYLTGNLASQVLIVTFSEFGRTIRQNAYNPGPAGTDHATSAPQFVIGAPVIGGQQYGAYPLLDNPGSENEDDLRMTCDFRDLFGTILARWLNVSVTDIGPGAGKIFPATPQVDSDGNSYTSFTPIGFLPP
jgi:uncharacterized protein (DUF1501 family)